MALAAGCPRVHTVIPCRLHASSKMRASAGTRQLSMPSYGSSMSTDSSAAATRIAGEWDGVSVSFNSRGEAVELPHSVVPDAFREWGVTLVAWQTQCSMRCSPDGNLHYTMRRLFPTVGCEADAVAFEEHSADSAPAVWLSSNGSFCLAPATLCSNSLNAVVQMCLPLPDVDGTRRRVRITTHLSSTNASDRLVVPRTVDVVQERFDRPLDGRVELGGCGGGLTSFADLPAAQLTDVQATGWVASDHNCPQTWCAPKPSVPSLQCPGPRCGRHSWSAVPDDADNPVLLLLPGRHWCYVGQVGHSVTLQVGVVAGSSTRWVGGVLYDEDGALVDAFVGQDVMDKA